MNSDNKISIVVPFFNRIQLLEKTIESVLHQSSEDWELILVDDGSTEDTSILRKYTISPKIRLFKNEKETSGAPSARNFGASKAQYSYLMFLDSDDLMAPWCIGSRLDHLKKEFGHNVYIFQAIEFNNEKPNDYRLRTIFGTKEPLKLFLSFQSVWQTSCMLWRKEVFNAIDGWNESLKSWQDAELSIRYLLNFEDINWGHAKPDVFIRKHEDRNRISNQVNLAKIDNLFSAYLSTKRSISDDGLRQLFSQNIKHTLFDFVEANIDYDKFISWVNNRLKESNFRRTLIIYLRLYKMFNRSMFLEKTLYQLRKIGVPNKRRGFWSIRPKLSEQKLNELNEMILSHETLKKEIKLLR